MQRLTEYLGDFVAYRRVWAWGLVVSVTALAALGWSGRRVFDRERPSVPPSEELSALREAYQTFHFGDSPYILVFECDDLFHPRRIAVLRGLAAMFEREAAERPVMWIGKVPRLKWLRMVPVLPPAGAPREDFQRAREELLEHPLAAGQLLSADGKMTLMMVGVPWGAAEIEQVAKEACEGSGMRVRLTGTAALRRAQQVAFDEDHLRVVVIACGLVLILATIIFRRPSAILIVAAGPALGLIWTLGLLQLFGRPSSYLVDIILPVMVLMIAFTDGVHLVIHLRQARSEGADAQTAARSAVCHVGRACALTSLTTAVGFGSLMISDAPDIYEFGRASVVGVLVTFLAVILVIPLLSTSWLGRQIQRGHRRDPVARTMRRLSFLTDVVARRARWVAAGGIILSALLAAGALTLEPDHRRASITPHAAEAYQAMLDCDREFGGIRLVHLVVEWPEGAGDDEIWDVLAKAEARLVEEPLLRGPLSIRNCLAVMPGKPSSKKLSLVGFVPEEYRGLFWRSKVRRALIVAHVQDRGIAQYGPVLQRVRGELTSIEQQHPGFRFRLTGRAMVTGLYAQGFIRDLAWSLALAAVVIFVMLSWAYRSIRIGLISVIPNLLPLAATASLRAVWDSSLDIASACSLVICLGIAVDDTIHFLTRFQRELAEGQERDAAIRRAFVAVGNALVVTTVVMIAGFATVLTGQLPTHRSFAAMACITLGAALVADLVVLPALLVCFFRPDKAPDDVRDDVPDDRTAWPS